jgi:hypothetical protein
MPCRIVAALETNHGGDPDVARRLLEAARAAGADGIKFQKRTVAVAGVRQVLDRRLTDYTANVYPTKLNEYLAMGIPLPRRSPRGGAATPDGRNRWVGSIGRPGCG